MQNLTRLINKINNLWIKSQFPTQNLTNIKRIDVFLILFICVIISIITSYELVTKPIQNFYFIIPVTINFLEILICSCVLVYIAKKEDPNVNTRQNFLLVGLLLIV